MAKPDQAVANYNAWNSGAVEKQHREGIAAVAAARQGRLKRGEPDPAPTGRLIRMNETWKQRMPNRQKRTHAQQYQDWDDVAKYTVEIKKEEENTDEIFDEEVPEEDGATEGVSLGSPGNPTP